MPDKARTEKKKWSTDAETQRRGKRAPRNGRNVAGGKTDMQTPPR